MQCQSSSEQNVTGEQKCSIFLFLVEIYCFLTHHNSQLLSWQLSSKSRGGSAI